MSLQKDMTLNERVFRQNINNGPSIVIHIISYFIIFYINSYSWLFFIYKVEVRVDEFFSLCMNLHEKVP